MSAAAAASVNIPAADTKDFLVQGKSIYEGRSPVVPARRRRRRRRFR